MKGFVLLMSLSAATALAQPTEDAGSAAVDGGVPSSLLDELNAALGTPLPSAGAPSPSPSPSPVVRALQSLNPDLSAVLDVTGGWTERAPTRLSGDDPDLGGGPTQAGGGVTIQEAEIALQATVDPYFKGELYLTIPNLRGVEIEEGFVTTTALPFDLQVKAGAFRSSFGRQNGQHLHLQDFTRRPMINASYLGTDGLRAPGAQVSWLAPVPFFLQLNLEALSVAPADDPRAHATFGGGARTDLAYLAELKSFAPITESLSASFGVSGATGLASGTADLSDAGPLRSFLGGADLYVKYKPVNQADSFFSLAWTTEYVVRKLGPHVDGGLYTQLVLQVARRWFVGLREDLLGLPASSLQPLVARSSVSVTFTATEFARLRGHLEREFLGAGGVGDAWGAYLQLEVSLGAHGAHPF